LVGFFFAGRFFSGAVSVATFPDGLFFSDGPGQTLSGEGGGSGGGDNSFGSGRGCGLGKLISSFSRR
jgi:hypothetical protein